jgi:hypothetical protein
MEGLLQEGDEACDKGRATEHFEQNCKKSRYGHFSPFVFDRFFRRRALLAM